MSLLFVVKINGINNLFFTHLRYPPDGTTNHMAGRKWRNLKAIITFEQYLKDLVINIFISHFAYSLAVFYLLHFFKRSINIVECEMSQILYPVATTEPVIKEQLTHLVHGNLNKSRCLNVRIYSVIM